jgi:hypothetical protein
MINGSFWLGTMFGASLSLLLLNKNLFPVDLGWRLAFGLGAVLGLGILLVRRHVPESPRWLFIHGHNDQAEELVGDSLKVRQRHSIGFGVIAHTAFKRYPKADRARPVPVHRPGLPLQRRLLHPGAGAEHLLRGEGRRRARLHHPVRVREPARGRADDRGRDRRVVHRRRSRRQVARGRGQAPHRPRGGGRGPPSRDHPARGGPSRRPGPACPGGRPGSGRRRGGRRTRPRRRPPAAGACAGPASSTWPPR